MRIENGQPVPEYRVTALYYRFKSEVEEDGFEKAEAQSGLLGSFTYTLADGALKAVPSEEFRSRDDAKEAIEPYLRDWEQIAYLGSPPHRIKFIYERSDVEEINPVPGHVTVFPEGAVGFGSVLAAAVIARSNRAYPKPDPAFRRTPITDRLVERLRRVRGREAELPAAAYFVLTTLEREFGGPKGARGAAASTLAVDPKVLDHLGRLSSRADPDIGRKAKGDITPLNGAEVAWIMAAMALLIRRAGEHGGGGPLAPITLADLPPLP